MASVRGPLFGLAASGTIADTLTFSVWKGRAYVRQTVTPANPRSALQRSVRSIVSFTSKNYNALSTTDKGYWKTAAEVGNITPMNAFVRDAENRRKLNTGPRENPITPAGSAPNAPTSPVATGGNKQFTFTWVDSTSSDHYATMIYASETTGFTPGPSNLIAVIIDGVNTVTITQLEPGTWYIKAKAVSTTGVLSTATSQVSATVT